MTAVLFVAAIAALALSGLVILAIPYVRSLDMPAAASIALATGWVMAAALMFSTSVIHIRWSRTLLVAVLLPFAITGVVLLARRPRPKEKPRWLAWIPFVIILAIVTWGVLGARYTCSDYAFIWGPKAAHFWSAHRIDVDFLADPQNYQAHADYPPLLPLVYAWGALMTGTFSWWGGLLLFPLCLLAMTIGFRGIAARAIGPRAASLFALLLLAVIAFCSQIDPVGGAGEPPLLLFEALALAAVTFAPDDRGALVVASILAAGAVLTKVEGTMFAAILAIGFAITRRQVKGALILAAPSAMAIGSWLLFVRHHRLLDIYGGGGPAHFENVGRVIKMLVIDEASYMAWYLPVIAVVAPMIFARRWRRAALPLLVAAGMFAAAVYVYLHAEDPTFFIASSARRLLLTPLLSLAVASAAASE